MKKVNTKQVSSINRKPGTESFKVFILVACIVLTFVVSACKGGGDKKVASGAELYRKTGCYACHGKQGEGNNTGPNLSDKYWLHGCSQKDIEYIISEGIPAKGMANYNSLLSEDEITELSKFIIGLSGTNPADAAAPQGNICE